MRIIDYPRPGRGLDGAEAVAGMQDGRQVQISVAGVAAVALAQVRREIDPEATAYGSWLAIPGNEGGSIEDFLASITGPPGPAQISSDFEGGFAGTTDGNQFDGGYRG